jgi:hypothetical protein
VGRLLCCRIRCETRSHNEDRNQVFHLEKDLIKMLFSDSGTVC